MEFPNLSLPKFLRQSLPVCYSVNVSQAESYIKKRTISIIPYFDISYRESSLPTVLEVLCCPSSSPSGVISPLFFSLRSALQASFLPHHVPLPSLSSPTASSTCTPSNTGGSTPISPRKLAFDPSFAAVKFSSTPVSGPPPISLFSKKTTSLTSSPRENGGSYPSSTSPSPPESSWAMPPIPAGFYRFCRRPDWSW